MRIDANHKLRDVGDVGAVDSSSTRAQANAAGKTSSTEDVAELSPDRVRMQSLVSQVNQAPEVRQEKVTALGQAIRQGNYDVTPEQTAAAMLEDLRSAA